MKTKKTAKYLWWLPRVSRQYFKRPINIAAIGFILFVCFCGLLAEFLASEKPLMCCLNEKLYLFPNIIEHSDLIDHDNQTIERYITKNGGWAILPPVPYGPNQAKILGTIDWLTSPNSKHLLGTDNSGRDVLSRIIYGARSAVLVGFGSMIICTIFGIFLGAIAAYFGGLTDRITLFLIETLTTFPTFFLILVVQGLLGTSSLIQLVFIIGATRWTDVARVTRAEVMRSVNEDYVDAAIALGLGNVRIITRHVLPGSLGPVLVSATFGVAGAILIESTLSFLGYGAPSPTASWGQLLTDAFDSDGYYWLTVFPGIALFATVLSVNLAGEGLSDAIDSRR